MTRSCIPAILSGFVALTSLIAQPRPESHHQPPLPPHKAEIATDSAETIDGSKHPDRVPDVAAYLMLFRSMADRPGALTFNQRARFLTNAGFSSGQARWIIWAADRFERESQGLDAKADRIAGTPADPNSYAALRTLQIERESLLTTIYTDMENALDPTAKAVLERYLQIVKAGIKLAPSRMF